MPKILAVCHSVGDSQVVFESAKEMISNQIDTSILVIGTAARSKIQTMLLGLTKPELQRISMIDLDELLPQSKPIQNGALILDDSMIDELSEKLNISEYSGLLVGTPSYANVEKQCAMPEQLLAKWGPMLHSAVVSDYAFYDPEHNLARNRWFERAAKFLLPFSKAKEAFGATKENVIVVGHPSIDASKKLYGKWVNERVDGVDQRILDVRNKLGILDNQKFIFVAGGKAGDEAMIQALAQTCQNYPHIKIFLGMHPAAEPSYLASINEIISECNLTEQIQFITQGLVTTDEAVYAAEGVMTVSSTVGTTAAACGKLVTFYQEGKKSNDCSIPYIVSDCESALFCSSNRGLLPFYKRVSECTTQITAANVTVENTAAENIAKEMKLLVRR